MMFGNTLFAVYSISTYHDKRVCKAISITKIKWS